MTTLRWGAATDVGRVRTNNEDSMLLAPDLFAVADGMGGHKGGEVASRMALEVLRQSYEQASVVALVEAAEQANREVFGAAGHEPDLRGMGTTLVAIAPIGETGELGWINVGDSRLYLLRDGQLTKLSIDHSLVEDMVRDGRISEAEARVHPKRNIVTRALGISPHVDVDPGTVVPHVHDRYLLCSDGLYDVVDDDQIASVLRRLAEPDDVAHELVRLSNEGGGRDNITVIVLDVVDDGDGALNASTTIVGGGEGHAEFGHLFTQAAGPATDGDTDFTNPVDGRPPEGWSNHLGRADEDGDPAGGRPEPTGRLATVPAPGPAWVTDTEDVPSAIPPPPPTRHRRGDREATVKPPRRLTWRVLLFLVLLVGILGGGAYAVRYEARNTYFVGFDNNEVVIFRGRPGGLLWINPTVDARTGIARADVPQQAMDQLQSGKQVDSKAEALTFVDELRNQITESSVPTTTTTTTPASPATTVPPPTTVGPPFNGTPGIPPA